MLGLSDEECASKLDSYLTRVTLPILGSTGHLSDAESALGEILDAVVSPGTRYDIDRSMKLEATVAEIVTNASKYEPYIRPLELKGVKVVKTRDGRKILALNVKTIVGENGLLAQSERWRNDTALGNVLCQLHGPLRPMPGHQAKISGRTVSCHAIDLEALTEWCAPRVKDTPIGQLNLPMVA